jgi:hypothetical protein
MEERMSDSSHAGPPRRHRRDKPRLGLVWLLTLLLALTAMAVDAAAAGCPTTVTTTLSGESKEGEAITVLEGSAVMDQATLSGNNAGKAGGTVTYSVYSDKECKTLVAKAGEVTVSSGKVPVSNGEKLTGGATYYWQASYKGDEGNQAGTSTCGKEVATVKGTTSLATLLLAEKPPEEEPLSELEEEEPEPTAYAGEEVTAPTGAAVGDTAKLSGTNVEKASGTITYAIYSDKECKTRVGKAGEVTVANGVVPESSEEKLEAGTYYWQATYSGDSSNEGSTSACGKEIATVKAATSLTTTLQGEGREGEQLTVAEGASVNDTATLAGADAPMATGTVTYDVYSDGHCEGLVAEAGKFSVSGESLHTSNSEKLAPGTYYWRATYSGDTLNYPVKSICGIEVSIVTRPVTTALSGEGNTGEEVQVLEGAGLTDKATLHGEHAASATGTVKYNLYSDEECKALAAKAGEVMVTSGSVPTSVKVTPSPGTYYWQAAYSGNANNPASTSACASEIAYVETPVSVSTSLSTEGQSSEKQLKVGEEVAVSDKATLTGANTSTAAGYVNYNVYSDSECTRLAALAGSVKVIGKSAPESEQVKLKPGTYYWQAEYTGDGLNHSTVNSCGSEVEVVTVPITMELYGEERAGQELEVMEKSAVAVKATLHGEHASIATGVVKYKVYSDSECKELVAKAGEVTVSGESVPASNAETLAEGTYYWQAEYSGDAHNSAAKSACAGGRQIVLGTNGQYAAIGDSFSSGEGAGSYYNRTNRWGVFRRETFNQCHRTTKAWPARVASAFFNNAAVTNESEVFKQLPPSFIFRACSGDGLQNLWNAEVPANIAALGGKFNEAILGPPETWFPTPAQDLWLERPGGTLNGHMANPLIRLVTLTSGGNDAGFSPIFRNCVRHWLANVNTRRECEEVMREWSTSTSLGVGSYGRRTNRNLEGLESIPRKLINVLSDIYPGAAPNAQILVPLYPRLLDFTVPGHIWLNYGFYIENQPQGIATQLDEYDRALDERVLRGVEAWKVALPRGVDVHIIYGTQLVFPQGLHLLGDPTPWVNGIVLPNARESGHPNCLGQIALAEAVLREIDRPIPNNWGC